jgi:hypothetical protein
VDPDDGLGNGGTDGPRGIRLPEGQTVDPTTCEEAARTRSYVGCDYWPTVTPNGVWSEFDYAVVVANTGTAEANITVTGPNGLEASPIQESVPPGELKKIYLPWVKSLKGSDVNECASVGAFGKSVFAAKSAYHLVSTSPVIVYQFNALQYSPGNFTFSDAGAPPARPDGGPAGGDPNDWATCPGATTDCNDPLNGRFRVGCFSYSNDASLLLPSTAMTNNYRLAGPASSGTAVNGLNSFAAITATQPGATTLTIRLSARATVVAGDTIRAAQPGGTIPLRLEQGDVAMVTAATGENVDLSGSLVQSDKPVQVVSGIQCVTYAGPACDHVEETVLPAETLGTQYVIARPTAPNGRPAGHVVKFYGNVDGTRLTYYPARPNGCPGTLNAGEVVTCNPGGPANQQFVNRDFVVVGDKEFAVGTFLLGGSIVDPQQQTNPFGPPPPPSKGDPSQSQAVAIQQFRTKYLFLAPTDYDVNYVDIVTTQDAEVTLDGQVVRVGFEPIAEGLGVRRVRLGPGREGAHELTSTRPVGIQVIGYGAYTSYQYPGGLNLALIAAPPR